MNNDTCHEEQLLTVAREALSRGCPPPEGILKAIHEEAQRHAVGRSVRWSRGWSLWRRTVLGFGGAVAALLLLWFAMPDRSRKGERADTLEELPDAAIELMFLAGGSVDTVPNGGFSDYLLRFQEIPGEFERAHALYTVLN